MLSIIYRLSSDFFYLPPATITHMKTHSQFATRYTERVQEKIGNYYIKQI